MEQSLLAETINGLYKVELIHRRAHRKTKESIDLATLECVSWLNHHRLLEPIGYIPPAKAESNYYRQLASQAALWYQPDCSLYGVQNLFRSHHQRFDPFICVILTCLMLISSVPVIYLALRDLVYNR